MNPLVAPLRSKIQQGTASTYSNLPTICKGSCTFSVCGCASCTSTGNGRLEKEDMTTKLKKLTQKLVVEDVQPSVVREFRQVPGVGTSMAKDLWNLGLRAV